MPLQTIVDIMQENKVISEKRLTLKAQLIRIEAALQDCENIAMTRGLQIVSELL
jgi:hypothetical protein